jgi:hypothetical protein
MLRTQFPEIEAISTYGGEELNPPQYGHVAIAVKITDVEGLPDSKIQSYKRFLSDKNSLTTQTVFVNPKFSYIAIRSTVSYNINLSTLTPDNIRTLVVSTIQAYADTNLGDFAGRFRYSRFCAAIDTTDISIVGNETDVLLYKKISPRIDSYQNIDLEFGMPLQPGVIQPNNVAAAAFHSVYSSNFFINGVQTRFEDNGQGSLYIVTSIHGVESFTTNVGTVDYDTGLVRLIAFSVDNYDGNHINVYVRPREKDILENKATILDIEGGEIQITVETVRE